jgi:hypothetical protein
MATIAPQPPPAIIASVAPAEALTFGTGAQACNGSELHGQDFKLVHEFIFLVRRRTQELSEAILAVQPDEGFTYNIVPPLRSYFVEMTFERGGKILPVPFELDEE